MASRPPSPSPPLEGYDTAGEEATAASSGEESVGCRTRGKGKTPRKPVKRSPRKVKQRHATRDEKGLYVSMRGNKQPAQTGSSDYLGSLDSLTWDAHTEPLIAEERAATPISLIGSIYGNMAEVDQARDNVVRALMEVEDDVMPFRGKNLTTPRLDVVGQKASDLKKALQDGHLYLMNHDAEEYEANLKEQVIASRRDLSELIVELEETKARRQDAAAEAARTDNRAAADAEMRHQARQELVRGRVAMLQGEVKALVTDSENFCTAKAASDEELYERAEKHKVICSRLTTALEECKVIANQALEHDLIEESSNLDGAVAKLRSLKLETDNAMLSSRRTAGVWSEKGRRAAARGDMKMPAFSASGEKLTIYEFEKEWVAYKTTVNNSVEEALKELKMAVQPPTRAAVQKMSTEKQIFDYLKAHFGNPVVLLSAREEEVRSWGECKGTDGARREWLIHAKDRL